MKLITLSGVDGSGKTSQIELLKNYLDSQGKKIFYFHAVNFSLANKLSNKKDTLKDTSSKAVTKSSWLGIFLRKVFLLIDIRRFKKLVQKLERQGYDYILSDRYFFDSVINIQFLSGNNKKILAEKYIPRPDLSIYLNVTPEAIMQRERIPEQGMNYLIEKQKLFENKISDWKLNIISADGNKEEVFAKIKAAIKL